MTTAFTRGDRVRVVGGTPYDGHWATVEDISVTSGTRRYYVRFDNPHLNGDPVEGAWVEEYQLKRLPYGAR
jgi:hypothetical protein